MRKTVKRCLLLCLLLTAVTVLLAACGLETKPGGKVNGNNQSTTAGTKREVYTCSLYQDGECLGSSQIKEGDMLTEPEYTLADDNYNRYTILGWDADGDGQPETFPYEIKGNTDFILLYTAEPIIYHYDMYVKGELVQSADAHYGDTITYPDLKSEIVGQEVYFFRGWKYDGIFDGYRYNQVTRSCRIDAYYADTQVLKILYNGGVNAQLLDAGTVFDIASILGITPGADERLGLYLDANCTVPYTPAPMPAGNLTVYVRLEVVNQGIAVSSKQELLNYFNSMVINRIPTAQFHLNFSYGTLKSLLNYLTENAIDLCNYETSASEKSGNLTLNLSFPAIATKKSTRVYYTQLASDNVKTHVQTRSAAFNEFAVERLTDTFYVCNSDALYFALESGYKPVIDANDMQLQALYNAMKDVLRRIIDDNMTDLQKARAIYEYLILETTYDAEVMNLFSAADSKQLAAYNAFYLEGVFNDRLAVCDGFAKAYSCLCSMEGIPCVRVTGVTADRVNHAWNKVYINGNWYVVDVTSGGCISDTNEILTYAYFMVTDAQYAKQATEDGKHYSEIDCVIPYVVYRQMQTQLADGTKVSLAAPDVSTAAQMILGFLNRTPGSGTFDFYADFAVSSPDDTMNAILQATGETVEVRFISDGNCFTVIK